MSNTCGSESRCTRVDTFWKVREERTFYTRGHGRSGKVRQFETFCTKSQRESGKKIPLENEVSRSTFGFQNCFDKKSS